MADNKTKDNEYKKGISVIIPVYRAESYIKNCITSLMIQTFKELELIFVIDKNSNDDSERIIRSYADKTDNIKIITPTSGCGAGYNRNVGIEYVDREYIGFVDADDCISKNYYEKLYNAIKTHDATVAMAETVFVDENNIIVDYHKYGENVLEDIDSILPLLDVYSVWDKVYSTKVIKENKDIRFPEGVMHEDNGFTLSMLLHTSKFVTVSGACYYWTRHFDTVTDVTTKQKQNEYIQSGVVVFDCILDTLKKSDLPLDTKFKIVETNVKNYAVDTFQFSEYRNYFLEKLKSVLGRQKAYEIFYSVENN